jgi:hypothetical protein
MHFGQYDFTMASPGTSDNPVVYEDNMLDNDQYLMA